MKKILRLTTTLIVLLFLGGNAWGQTTVSYDFSDVGAVTGLDEPSPGIALDANIGFGSFKNSGTSDPVINGGQLRLYQNATKVGSIKVYASNGVTITQVIVHASGTAGTGPAAYSVDGVGSTALSINSGAYTMSGLSGTSNVEFWCTGNSSSTRIYVDNFEVTYTTGGNTPPSITNILQDPASDVTPLQTVSVSADVTDAAKSVSTVELHWGTTSGSLGTTIAMSNTGGDTYTTDTDIPTQVDGTTVYYEIEATDDESATTTSAEQSYVVSNPSSGGGLEDFTNSNATASYGDGSFVGNNGITWTYIQSRDGNKDLNGSGIDLPALMLRRASDDSKVTSSAISGGIGDFSIKLYKGFTGGGDRQVELFVNGISQGTSTVFDDLVEHNFVVNGINISGDIVIEIRNITSNQVIVDDISWTAYSGGSGVDAPTLFSATANSQNQIDLTWSENATGNNVLIAWSSDGTFGDPVDGTTYASSATIPGGGTSLGTDPDEAFSHTGLSSNTQYFYKIWSVDASTNYSTGVEANATTFAAEPSAHPTGFGATANSSSEITVSWTDATPAADGYLIKGSNVSYGDIAVPVDGTAETNSLLVQNVASGGQTFQFTGLAASTTYYFKIYPYNGSAASINYKIDGTVPETSATTDAATAYDNVETFDNFGATGNSYSSGTFEGQDGSTWTYTEARGDVEITGKALMVGRNRTPQSEVYSGTLGGGIQVLNFDYMQAFGTNVNLNVLVNDVVVGNVTSTSELELVKNSGDITVNISGNFVLKFKNVNNSNGQVVIDNISWNSISAFSAYNGTGNWTNTSNWSNGLPTGTTDVIINGNVTVDNTVACNDMTISPLGAVTVGAGQGLIINGNLLIESSATGTGSFIGATADYDITGTTTIQRYLTGGWDGWDAGWHQLSSPVAAQPISAFATTGVGNDYDFYGWEESTNMWMNYKDAGFSTWNGGTNFNVGQGYLVSYEAANTTQTFTGELNWDDFIIVDMSSAGSSYNGWHLLGNPYASALKWNDGNWDFQNVAGNAKIWHETNKSYSDIAPNGIIPSAQGFMVQVNDADNGLILPAASRVHSATPFYKTGTEQLLLVAAETEGGSAQESKIMVNPMATEGFDFDFDSRFLAGYAPQLYSVVGDELLSTNSLPELASGKVIPLGFVKNAATTFTIELKESIPAHAVYLTDKKTDIVTNLSENPVYSFTSSEGDDPNRFELKFGAVGIDDNVALEQISIYSHGQSVYISSAKSVQAVISIYNITGQQVYANTMVIDGQKQIALNTPTGWYITKVTTAAGVATQKVFIKSN